MSRFRRFDIVDHYLETKTASKPLLLPHFPTFPTIDDLDCSVVDLLGFTSPEFEFDTITDLIQFDEININTPFVTSTRRITRRVVPGPELLLKRLSDRVSELELGLDELLKEKKKKKATERKYTWTAEIKGPEEDDERKYKWTKEVKDGKKSESKWTAEIKGRGGERTYTYKVSSAGDGEVESENKKTKKKGKGKVEEKEKGVRVVEIEEPAADHGSIVLRQAFAKRLEKSKGKRSELSYQDAAALIQMSFRAYLIRRSQALRALRELAIAKNKLKEIRSLFNNFSYRRKIARDAEERQRFSEKVIVLLLTVDAIEGSDLMVRAAKKSMVDELEAMLDVVDPQPPGKSVFMRRRTFDMPDAGMNKELAEGVAQVVRMLDEEATSSETFEACL